MRPVLSLLLCIWAAVTLRCSSSADIAGGGSSDQGNSMAVGRAVFSDGSGAEGAIVKMVPEDFRPGPGSFLPDSLSDTADSKGNYHVKIDTSVIYNVYIIHEQSGFVSLREDISASSENDTMELPGDTLGKPDTLYLAYPEGIDADGYAYIEGTLLYQAVSSSKGYIIVTGLPFSYSADVSFTAESGSVEPVTLSTPILLVDDFDDNDIYNELYSGSSGEWQVYSDADSGGNSYTEPAGVDQDFTSALYSDGSYDDISAGVRFVFMEGYSAPFGGFFCSLSDESSQYIDLSSMTGLSFACRGSGRLRVNFRCRAAVEPYPSGEDWGQPGKIVELTSNWQRVTIPAEELAPPAGSLQEADSLKWDDCADQVEQITFTAWIDAGDTADIHVDDIFLKGVSKEILED